MGSRLVKRILVAGIVVSAVLVGGSRVVFADSTGGGSATPDGGGTPTSRPCTTGYCYSKSRGGAWVKYTGNISDSIHISGELGISGGTLSYCKSIGATEYYVLAPALFHNGQYVRQFGMMPVSDFKAQGWTYNRNIPGSISMATAAENFKLAKSAAKDAGKPIDISFNNASAFCFNPEWKEPKCDSPECKKQTGDATFYSTSTVEVFDPDITGGVKETSERDGKVSVYLSTDKTSVEVEFSHMLGYDHREFKYRKPGDIAIGDTVTTEWEVDGEYKVDRKTWGRMEPDKDNTSWPDVAKQRVVFEFGENEYGEKEKCSTITYTRKDVSLTGAPEIRCNETSCWVEYYKWSASYSGSGSSTVCATVVRPEPPKGAPGPTRPTGGLANDVMFAGETTSLIWRGISGQGVPTRRLRDAEAIKFLVDEIPTYDSNKLAIKPDSKFDPCATYTERFGNNLQACLEHARTTHETAIEENVSEVYDSEASVKVPDEVGYKYCHSYGYSFEYWYGVLKGTNKDRIRWTHDTPKDYWFVYNASCRGVAKKPSTAVWNGSILAKDGIVTSLARRHNTVNFGEAASDDKTLYGSWAEYLVATNTKLDKERTMGSGSSLSNGSSNSKLCDGDVLASNSTLTIANSLRGSITCDLQPSGIMPSSTLRTRLYAYLRDAQNNPQIKKTTNINDLYAGIRDNIVLVADGDLEITNDIKISDTTEYTLHNTPQAVIFTSGDVNIAENVTRIDAWVIALNGTINTCTSFNSSTSSDSKNSAGSGCTQQLVFNGTVMAQDVKLQRSFGADPTVSRTGTFGTASSKQAPAEVFNLRADTYLWAYAQAARYDSSYIEVYSRELAPRY